MSTGVPPLIPTQQPPVIAPPRLAVAAPTLSSIAGAEGLTPADLRNAVAQGGRFVLFQYCFSVVVLSFKRSSPIYFLKPGESAFAKGAPYSLISLVAGWWGIPWGPIWTLVTLGTNLGGGKDVTRDMLSAFGLSVPVAEAAPLVSPVVAAEREARKSLILRMAWGATILLFLGMVWVGYKVFVAVKDLPLEPGHAEFRAANARIGSAGRGDSGNTPEAAGLAAQMSQAMQAIRSRNFEATKEKSFMDRHDQFKTSCDLRPDQCVFLIHVPELRQFAPDAQRSLGQMAWLAAQAVLDKTGANKPGMRLAVGLRGIAAFDRVLTGQFTPGATDARSGPPGVSEGFGCERELYTWFAEDQSQASGPASPRTPKRTTD